MLAVLALLSASSSFGTEVTESPLPSPIDYSRQYDRKIAVETPEVYELVNVAIAITEFGKSHPYYIASGTEYHAEVLEHFEAHGTHPFILAIQEHYGDVDGFNLLKQTAVASHFVGDRIACDTDLILLESEAAEVRLELVLSLATEFAKDTGFRSFYRDHLPFYQQRCELFKMGIPAVDGWRWLEKQFPQRYPKYRIYLSPLTGWSHFSVGKKNGVDTYIFGPEKSVQSKVEEGSYTMVLFTEIDHHYVDPVSRGHTEAIDDAFSDLGEWNTQGGYRSPFLTFSEYMTWSVFCLFASERYDEEDFAEINRGTVEFMAANRKFVKFGEFNEQLLSLYRNRKKGEKIPDLVPRILEWARNSKPRAESPKTAPPTE
jgi:hypothetical protein